MRPLLFASACWLALTWAVACSFPDVRIGEPACVVDSDCPKLCNTNTGQCTECLTPSDCEPGFLCQMPVCVPPHCADNLLSQTEGETDVDCGGPCAGCPLMASCLADEDCESGACRMLDNKLSCVLTCDQSSDCIEPETYCQDMTCVPQLAGGVSCQINEQCLSSYCVDGVCCDSSCRESCVACTAALKGNGNDGSCGPIQCDPYFCSNADESCPDSCGSDTDCIAGYFCGNGQCQPKKAIGQDCGAANECHSSFCPADDSVCCDAPCDQLCKSCLGAFTGGTTGSCDDIAAGTDPFDECLTLLNCNGSGACL